MRCIIRVAERAVLHLAPWLLCVAALIGRVEAGANAWLQTAQSRLGFIAVAESEPVTAEFKNFTVRPAIDGAGAPIGFEVTIELQSLDSGDAERDASLRAPPWFDVAAHPLAHFRSQAVIPGPNRGLLVRGDLLLNGVEQSLEVPFTWRSIPAGAEMAGEIALDRRQYGIGPEADDLVDAQVTVFFALQWREP